MRYELIIAGTTLLVCALSVKALWEKTSLARLALCFNILWAVLVAFHFSGEVSAMAGGFLAGMENAPVEAVAFWFGFILSALPGWAFVRWGLGGSPADMPLFFERISGVLATTVIGLLFPCLVIMTVAILPFKTAHVLPTTGVPGRCVAIMQKVPLQMYLRSVSFTIGAKTAENRLQQLPARLQNLARLPRGRRRPDGRRR